MKFACLLTMAVSSARTKKSSKTSLLPSKKRYTEQLDELDMFIAAKDFHEFISTVDVFQSGQVILHEVGLERGRATSTSMRSSTRQRHTSLISLDKIPNKE